MNENESSKFMLFIEKFKKLWADKRYRSLIILIMYFIFFLVLFTILEVGKETVSRDYNNTEELKLEDYQIYEFSAELIINDYTYNILGKRYNEKYEFEFENQLYTLDYNNLNIDIGINSEIINTFNYTPDFLANIVANSELVSEKTMIADNRLIKEYSLKLEKYLQILDYNLANYNKEDKLIVTTSELNDEIISVSFDLSNLYKYFEENYQKYEFTINYSNLNNVTEF